MQNKKLKIANKHLKQHQDHLRKHLPCSLYSFFLPLNMLRKKHFYKSSIKIPLMKLKKLWELNASHQ